MKATVKRDRSLPKLKMGMFISKDLCIPFPSKVIGGTIAGRDRDAWNSMKESRVPRDSSLSTKASAGEASDLSDEPPVSVSPPPGLHLRINESVTAFNLSTLSKREPSVASINGGSNGSLVSFQHLPGLSLDINAASNTARDLSMVSKRESSSLATYSRSQLLLARGYLEQNDFSLGLRCAEIPQLRAESIGRKSHLCVTSPKDCSVSKPQTESKGSKTLQRAGSWAPRHRKTAQQVAEHGASSVPRERKTRWRAESWEGNISLQQIAGLNGIRRRCSSCDFHPESRSFCGFDAEKTLVDRVLGALTEDTKAFPSSVVPTVWTDQIPFFDPLDILGHQEHAPYLEHFDLTSSSGVRFADLNQMDVMSSRKTHAAAVAAAKCCATNLMEQECIVQPKKAFPIMRPSGDLPEDASDGVQTGQECDKSCPRKVPAETHSSPNNLANAPERHPCASNLSATAPEWHPSTSKLSANAPEWIPAAPLLFSVPSVAPHAVATVDGLHCLEQQSVAAESTGKKKRRRTSQLKIATHLRHCESKDPACIFLAYKIQRLGFGSADLLRAHYQQYGPVDEILLSNEHENIHSGHPEGAFRLRPSGIAIIVMMRPEDALAAVAAGENQDVCGVSVLIRKFERRRDSLCPTDNLEEPETGECRAVKFEHNTETFVSNRSLDGQEAQECGDPEKFKQSKESAFPKDTLDEPKVGPCEGLDIDKLMGA